MVVHQRPTKTLFPFPLLDYLLMMQSYITRSHLQLMLADCRVTSMLSHSGIKHGWWSLIHPNIRFFGSHWSKSQPTVPTLYTATFDTADIVKYFWVSIDTKLNFNDYISAITKKARATRASLSRNIKISNHKIRAATYTSYIRPIVE